jgi:hypothetical protein
VYDCALHEAPYGAVKPYLRCICHSLHTILVAHVRTAKPQALPQRKPQWTAVDRSDEGRVGGIWQSAFETLRKLYEGGTVKTFAGEAARSRSTKAEFTQAAQDVGSMPVPSWEWYMDFETEIIPIYRVELAKTDRSKCNAKGAAKHCDDTAIEKGAIRIGWLDRQSGDYAYVTLWPYTSRDACVGVVA